MGKFFIPSTRHALPRYRILIFPPVMRVTECSLANSQNYDYFTKKKLCTVQALFLDGNLLLSENLSAIRSRQTERPMIIFEHTFAYARWAHMHHFLSVWTGPKFRLDKKSLNKKSLDQKSNWLFDWTKIETRQKLRLDEKSLDKKSLDQK